MKINKILSLLVAISMLFSVGITAMAEETTVAKIGDTPYATLQEAFKAATDGCTIEILSDIVIDSKWDCRDYVANGSHSQFKEAVTINGNGHTLKFTDDIDDGNWKAIFRFEENATVNNLTIDVSAATGTQRVITAKKSLNVDKLTIVGDAKYGIIFGEGASAADLAATEITITNSDLYGTRRAISDNEGGKDVKSVTITGNKLKANAYASASESITFTNNTAEGEVDLRSYTANNTLNVTATGNTLNPEKKNYIQAGGTVNAQDGFMLPVVEPTGTLSCAYTSANTYWGECGGNAKESFGFKFYNDNTYMGYSNLNNVGGIIDGDVYVSWYIKLDAESNTDEYWDMAWEIAPTIDMQPNRVEQWVDGVKVAECAIQPNWSDSIFPVVAAVTDADGKILSYVNNNGDATLTNAVKNSGNIVLLKGISGGIEIPEGANVVLDLNGKTITGELVGITNNGTLTINDSVGTGKVYTTDVDAQGRPAIFNNGNIVINGGWFGDSNNDTTDRNAINRGNAIKNYGTAEINGGYFTNVSNQYIDVNAYAYAINTLSGGTTTINNAVVYGDVNGLIYSEGTTVVNDGSFTLGRPDEENNLWYLAYGNVEIKGGIWTRAFKVPSWNTGDMTVYGAVKVSGGVFNVNIADTYIVEDCAAIADLNGNYIVGKKPTATVKDHGATVIPANTYGVWNGSSYTSTSPVDMPLNFVVEFLADETAAEGAASPYADWYADFVITFDGIENDSFVANGCYLAGHYGDFGWVKVPVDGMRIENGVRYPVMLGVGLGQKYDTICSSVQDFKCAMFLTPEILAANPNLKVKLELAMVDNSKGQNAARDAIINNTNVYSVTEKGYVAKDFVAEKLFKFVSRDATLGNSLAMNFYIKNSDLDGTDYYAEVKHATADGIETTNIPYSDWIDDVDTDRKYVPYTGIAARQMADEISITIYNGNGKQVSTTHTDSLRKYALAYLAAYGSTASDWVTAFVDMLNYGAAAQKYFKYNVNDLATVGAEAYQKYASKDVTLSKDATVSGSGYSTALILMNTIQFSAYFTDVTSDMYATVSYTDHYKNPHEYRIDYSDFVKNEETGRHEVIVDKLVVADAEQLVTVTMHKVDGTECGRISESINGYLYRVQKAYPDEELFPALAKFVASAKKSLH